MFFQVVVEPTHLKNTRKSNWESSTIFGVKIKHVWNKHPVFGWKNHQIWVLQARDGVRWFRWTSNYIKINSIRIHNQHCIGKTLQISTRTSRNLTMTSLPFNWATYGTAGKNPAPRAASGWQCQRNPAIEAAKKDVERLTCEGIMTHQNISLTC